MLQILVIGNQDLYLIGNPSITFFKQVFRRHTNFSIDTHKLHSRGDANFGQSTITTVEKYGDLLCGLYMDYKLPKLKPKLNLSWVDSVGHAIFEDITLQIDEKVIDKHNGEWLFIMDQLKSADVNKNKNDSSRRYGHVVYENSYQTMNNTLINNGNITSFTGTNIHNNTNSVTSSQKHFTGDRFMTPLRFWFCDNYGLSLPLLCIPYSTIYLKTSHRELQQLVNATTDIIGVVDIIDDEDKAHSSFKVWGEYIFLDRDEKRRFINTSHQYLIEVLNYQEHTLQQSQNSNLSTPVTTNSPYKYNYQEFKMNHKMSAVKLLLWVPHMSNYTTDFTISGDIYSDIQYSNRRLVKNKSKQNNWFNFSMYKHLLTDAIDTDTMYLFKNGHIRINNIKSENLPAMFYANVIPKRFCNIVPYSNYIYMYSFAINPLDHQPSGTCNFSALDEITLVLNDINLYTTDSTDGSYVNIYSYGYNILNINSGNIYLEYN